MASGRCAGCGRIDSSCAVTKRHLLDCEPFQVLYARNSGNVLGPEEEFIRWKAEKDSPEARQDAREERLSQVFARIDRGRERAELRWRTPRSILD